MVTAVRCAIGNAAGTPALDDNLPCNAVAAKFDALGDGLGPVGGVGRGFGAIDAADQAGAAMIAGSPPVVGGGIDSPIPRPPMPAQTIEAARRGHAEAAHG